MFDLRTARSRLAVALLAAMALGLTGCPESAPPEPDPLEEDGAEEDAPVEEDAAEDGAEEDAAEEDDTAGEDGAGEQAGADVFVAAAGTSDYGSCHEHSQAGGASDGVLFVPVDEEDAEFLEGRAIEIDVEKGDGTIVTIPGTLQLDGIVFLIPLSNFGEELTVVAARVDGEEVDPELVGQSFTVDPESDCEHHPAEG